MKTAIAILNWNGKKLLEEFLPSVVKNSAEADIYVIDNASTDDSVDFVKQNFADVKIILNDKNYGYAEGYNKGLKQIDADVFCLLNSDVKVTKNWLAPILKLFEADENISVIQPKILDYNNPKYFEYAGAGGGFIDNLGYPYCRGRVFWTLEEDKAQYDDTIPVFWASGACFFIRKDDFFLENGFDENYFAHMEEIDLCWRLRNCGKEIYYCGESTVFHLGGGTLQNSNPKKTYLNFRNSLFSLVKNLPAYKVFPVVFARMCLDGITACVFLVYEGFPHFWAVLTSHFGFYKKLLHFLKIRKPGIKKYSGKRFVPLQYFIQKKKYFSDLK